MIVEIQLNNNNKGHIQKVGKICKKNWYFRKKKSGIKIY